MASYFWRESSNAARRTNQEIKVPVTVSEISQPMIFRHEKIQKSGPDFTRCRKVEISKVLALMLVSSYRILRYMMAWLILSQTVVDQSE